MNDSAFTADELNGDLKVSKTRWTWLQPLHGLQISQVDQDDDTLPLDHENAHECRTDHYPTMHR